MGLIKGSRVINYFGELSDRSLENEFFQQDMQKSVIFIKSVVLILGIFNTMFVIPDYFLINNKNTFALLAACRILFILLVVVLFVSINFMKNFKVLAYWVTAYEVIYIMIFLFTYYKYETPNFLIQAFVVIVISLTVFTIPNRWINMLGVSVLAYIGFIVISVNYIKDIEYREFSAGIVYLAVVIILCSISAFRINFYKRIQYLNSKELMRLSTTDTLTGAYNRAKLNEELKRFIGYSRRYNLPLSLMIFDFDDFKKINDTYGHLVGDKVVIETAKLIINSVRETDILARWGGDEFVLLLPNTDIAHALDVGERLRKEIESYIFKEANRVTCSFGVVQLSGDDDSKSLLSKADQMLYSAKNAGKNIVKG